jgi:hypothetical protein
MRLRWLKEKAPHCYHLVKMAAALRAVFSQAHVDFAALVLDLFSGRASFKP